MRSRKNAFLELVKTSAKEAFAAAAAKIQTSQRELESHISDVKKRRLEEKPSETSGSEGTGGKNISQSSPSEAGAAGAGTAATTGRAAPAEAPEGQGGSPAASAEPTPAELRASYQLKAKGAGKNAPGKTGPAAPKAKAMGPTVGGPSRDRS